MISRLIVGEGKTEYEFLSHLKELYCVRGNGIVVKVDRAEGGSPHDILRRATSIALNGAYQQHYLLYDLDCSTPQFEREAARENFILIGLDPCFESMALTILGFSKKKEAGWSTNSGKAKSTFQKEYLKRDGVIDRKFCREHFGRERIEESRRRIAELAAIVDVFRIGKEEGELFR